MNTCTDGFEIFWVAPNLAVGAMPCKEDHITLLKEQGVGAVLNLCAEFCDLTDIEKDYGFKVHYLPIDDFDVPDPDKLEEALNWLQEYMESGVKVYIHCRFGMGRTGTVLYCLLLRGGLGQPEISRMCGTMPARPMNDRQWKFVTEFTTRHVAPQT